MVKRLIIAVLLLLVGGLVAYQWYLSRYSMTVIDGFEINAPSAGNRLLIASQGSAFKTAMVDSLVDRIRDRPVFIKVIDVTALGGLNADEWDAVIVLHTWEKWEPQADAAAWIAHAQDHSRILTIATSGSGEEHLDGVDAISSASVIATVPVVTEEVIAWLGDKLEH